MSDDPIALLERELVDAARRRRLAAPDGDELAARRGLHRRLPGALALAASILVVLVIAGGALLALRAGPERRGAPTTARLVAPWAARLAVLGRPQSRLDHVMLYRQGNDLPYGIIAPSSFRFARSTPWGSPVLMGVAVRGASQGHLVLATPTNRSISPVFLTTAQLRAGHGVVILAAHRGADHERMTRVVMIVGDGVAKVRIQLPHGRAGVGAVAGNVVAVQIPSPCCTENPKDRISVTEYGPGGSVVRHRHPTIAVIALPNGDVEG